MRAEFPQYRRPRPGPSGHIVTIVILIPIIFVLIIWGLGVAFGQLNPTPIRTTTETRAFNLGTGTQPTLIVTNIEGFVHVRSGTITNDFPLAPARKPGAYGRTVRGDVGSSPQATLIIQSDTGSLLKGNVIDRREMHLCRSDHRWE